MNSVIVEACLVAVFQEMHFANPMGGTFVLSYPLLFSPPVDENSGRSFFASEVFPSVSQK
jgi:hypothetical protein